MIENIQEWDSLGVRPLRGWEDDVNMVLKEVCYEDVEWTELVEDVLHRLAFVNTEANFWIL